MTLRISALPLVLLFCCLSFPSTAETSKADEKVVHLCAATPMNLSRRMVDAKWARNMLLRELKFQRKQKHSPVVIESIGLDAQQREEALAEAQDKNCDYIVLTTVIDPVGPGRIGTTVGPNGIEQRPQIIGNDDPNQQLAMKFSLLRPGSPRPLAEGVSTSPDAGDDDTAASTDAMRVVASRVAGEIRKPRVQAPD
jgi:hypothetical protein